MSCCAGGCSCGKDGCKCRCLMFPDISAEASVDVMLAGVVPLVGVSKWLKWLEDMRLKSPKGGSNCRNDMCIIM